MLCHHHALALPQVPVCFIPVREGGEERTGSREDASGFSLLNREEAQQVLVVEVDGVCRGEVEKQPTGPAWGGDTPGSSMLAPAHLEGE